MSSHADAEAWRRRGFRVFPLYPFSKVAAIKSFPERASNDPVQVLQFWEERDNANVGVAAGDGLLVIDVDVKDGKPGLESMRELGLDFETLTVRTPSGGFHLYYEFPQNVSNNILRPGLDVRSRGCYVLAPGSYFGGGFPMRSHTISP